MKCLYISKVREHGPADGINELKPQKIIFKVRFLDLKRYY